MFASRDELKGNSFYITNHDFIIKISLICNYVMMRLKGVNE